MSKVKGIRVNELAKELGVQSKAILDRIKVEEIPNPPKNHQSIVPLGLAESVREWFAGGGGVATATEPATEQAVDEAEAAPKPAPRRKKKAEEPQEASAAPVAEAEAAPAADAPVRPSIREPEAAPEIAAEGPEVGKPVGDQPVVEAPAGVAPPAATPAHARPAPAAPPVEHHEAPVAPAAPAAPALKPAASAPATSMPGTAAPARPARPGGAGPAPDQSRPVRPTVTLNDRLGGGARPPVERKPVTPAPQLLVPKPATIQGPRVVREEKPEVVEAPRRRPAMGGATGQSSTFVQARTQGGRGVKTGDEEGGEEAKKAGAKGRGSLSNRRRGLDGRRGEADAASKIKEFTEADLLERKERLLNAASARHTFDTHLEKTQRRGTHAVAKTVTEKGGALEIEEPITVKSLALALGIKANELITKLMRKGVMANINQSLDADQAGLLALDYGIELHIKEQATLEEQLEAELEAEAAKDRNPQPRPPVVTILGHVDHGKTSLLDKIRSANVAAGEAGGITQHTAAWSVTLGEGAEAKTVTFIDTPGHQAFTSMRARGANMTDVVVLVVAAVEGVMPQTIESINHARAAGVPIVVALNKIDRPDANPDMVLGQLAKEGLNPVEWGGETEVIRTSAVTGQGIPELIEILHYQAELLELKADPGARARGVVVEARMTEGLGAVATVLVQDGTLEVGDIVLAGPGHGRVRTLLNDQGKQIQKAGPSTPVLVSGLSAVPAAGDKFYALDDMDRARAISAEREAQLRHGILSSHRKVTLDNLFDEMKATEVKIINLIIKGDVQGSVETLAKTVTEQNTEEVKVRVIHAGVGPINESDVQLAMATKAKPVDNKVVIIGFQVVPDDAARTLAEQHHVEIRQYQVIYEIFDDLKKALSGMLAPEIREKLHGHAEVRQVFKVSRVGNIAGCMVTDGHILRGSKIRLIREGKIITEDLSLESLKRIKEDVREVKAGFECGIKLAGYDDIKIGDRFEAYIREEFERTL